MAYIITKADLKTHIDVEVVDEITNEDDDIVQDCIDAAILEAAGFMYPRYDIDKMLGTPDTDATVLDANLKRNLKNLVKFYLVTLADTSLDYASVLATYELTIDKYFSKIQKGIISPPKWVYLDKDDIPTPPEGLSIEATSNKRRSYS